MNSWLHEIINRTGCLTCVLNHGVAVVIRKSFFWYGLNFFLLYGSTIFFKIIHQETNEPYCDYTFGASVRRPSGIIQIILNKQRFNRKQTPGCVRPSTSPSFLLGTIRFVDPPKNRSGIEKKYRANAKLGHALAAGFSVRWPYALLFFLFLFGHINRKTSHFFPNVKSDLITMLPKRTNFQNFDLRSGKS